MIEDLEVSTRLSYACTYTLLMCDINRWTLFSVTLEIYGFYHHFKKVQFSEIMRSLQNSGDLRS